MARDRPSPYVPCGDCLFLAVARGAVPRDLSISAKNARNPENTDVCCSDRRMARDRPSPYGEVAFFIVARGPVPCDLHRHDVCFRRCSLRSPDRK